MAHSLRELCGTARALFSRGQQQKTFGQGYVMSHVIGSTVSVAQYRNVAYPEINLQMIKIYHLARTCAVFTVLCAMLCQIVFCAALFWPALHSLLCAASQAIMPSRDLPCRTGPYRLGHTVPPTPTPTPPFLLQALRLHPLTPK